MNQQKNAGASPQDIRNILLFSIVALAFYWAWNTYVLEPRKPPVIEVASSSDLLAVPEPAKQEKKEILTRYEALSKSNRITFSNEQVNGSIALKGAKLDDLSLSHYFKTNKKEEEVTLLSPNGTKLSRVISWGWQSRDIKTPDKYSVWSVKGASNVVTPQTPVTILWNNGQGVTFKRTFSLDENFVFTITQEVQNDSGKSIKLYPFSRLTQSGLPENTKDSRIQHEGPLAVSNNELTEIGYNKIRKKDRDEGGYKYQSENGWTGITDKYWLSALIPAQGVRNSIEIDYSNDEYHTNTISNGIDVASNGSATNVSHAFVGAKQVHLLDEYTKSIPAPKLNLAVNFGKLWFLSKPFFYMLHWIHGFVGNMGLAIIILTLLIRGAVFPLTNVSYRSFAHMKKVSPQILELRKKHGKDKSALQADIMKLYSKEKVNPMAGCLPILIQIPIFFALYKVLYVTIEMRHAPFIGWLTDLSAPDPTSVFNLFGLVPWDVPSILQIGVLPCLMLAALIVQKNLNPPPQDAMQRDLQTYFPFIMVVMLAHFPSGLVLYWTCSSIFSVAQQIVIMKSMGVEIHLFKKSKAEEDLEESLGHIGEHKDEDKDKKAIEKK